MVPIPEPMVPNGYNFFLIYVTVDTKCYPYPTPNRVFTHRVSGTHCHLYLREFVALVSSKCSRARRPSAFVAQGRRPLPFAFSSCPREPLRVFNLLSAKGGIPTTRRVTIFREGHVRPASTKILTVIFTRVAKITPGKSIFVRAPLHCHRN
jgi:hypothetical protein